MVTGIDQLIKRRFRNLLNGDCAAGISMNNEENHYEQDC
jgi:hypothetical protein